MILDQTMIFTEWGTRRMKISQGDIAPNFSLVDHYGAERQLYSELANGPVALVFYPLSFTGVCTQELETLQDNISEFQNSGVQLFAVSVDSMHTQRTFAESLGLEFSLLSDFWPHGGVAQQYGCFNEVAGVAQRATFFVDPSRKVREILRSESTEPRRLSEYLSAVCTIGPSS